MSQLMSHNSPVMRDTTRRCVGANNAYGPRARGRHLVVVIVANARRFRAKGRLRALPRTRTMTTRISFSSQSDLAVLDTPLRVVTGIDPAERPSNLNHH